MKVPLLLTEVVKMCGISASGMGVIKSLLIFHSSSTPPENCYNMKSIWAGYGMYEMVVDLLKAECLNSIMNI